MRIVIVGGVAGGMSAATRARRMNENADIIVLEKGGFISFANCGLPYYVAGRIKDETKLLITTPAKVAERFRIDARVRHEVISVDRAAREVEVVERSPTAADRRYRLPYDKLILATGAAPIVPPMAHVNAANVFLLRSMEDTRAVEKYLREHAPRSVAIVGAGFIGLEMAEAMRDRGLSVAVIEKAAHVLPPIDPEIASLVAAELARHEVNVIAGDGLAALEAHAGFVNTVLTESGQRVPADMVLLSIGVRPNVALAKDAGLNIGVSGAIAVDAFQRTSDPDIYAVGDAAEVVHGVTGLPTRIPLAGPANRQGRLAGEHAATGAAAAGAAKVLGTAIVQIFNLAVGMTGLSEEAARRAGLNAEAAHVLPRDHAGYYPGSVDLRIKLLYEPTTGRILGAQAIGPAGAGVDKRIDVIATAMHFAGTVDDLAGLDLAYAPQFGSAKDAVHIAAMVAQNQRTGVMAGVDAHDASVLVKQGALLLDVRTPQEFAAGTLAGAVNIPVDELRKRIATQDTGMGTPVRNGMGVAPGVARGVGRGGLDAARTTIVFCRVGQRGYIAERILRQNGFPRVRNLKGGILLRENLKIDA